MTQVAPNAPVRSRLAESARANVVLASVPDEIRIRLSEEAIELTLDRGETLLQQGSPLAYVYFPVSGLVTGVLDSAEGLPFAYLHRGREGAIFAIAAARLDDAVADCTLVVDVPAAILAVPIAFFRQLLAESTEVLRAVLTHAAYSLKFLERTANCPAHHAVQARAASWLLLLRAYSSDEVIHVTHSRIAEVLGVRRQSISEALGDLRARGMIELGRERIVITDASALRDQACACLKQFDEMVRLHEVGRLPVSA
jgi:CRP-like cAMP-binding protein